MNVLTASPIAQYQATQMEARNAPPPPAGMGQEHLPSSWRGGDQVQVSPEARALLDAKMQEFGVQDPGKLSPEQHEELKSAMDELREEQGLQGPPPGGGPPPKGGPMGMGGPRPGGGPPPGGAQGAEGGSDDIEDLEDEIEELEEEIEELEAEAAEDPEAKEELKTKRAELLLLEAELAMLQQQQQP